MSITTKWGVAAVLAATSLTLTACASGSRLSDAGSTASAGAADTVLNLAFFGDISIPDPDTAYDGAELNLVNSAYEGLVAYESGNPVPTIVGALATDWSVSEDNTVYTFTLREGVTFHDGTPFTSAAIAPSVERRVGVDRGPSYLAGGIASIETPSDYEVVITLEQPNAFFLDYLASPFGLKIISPAALEANAGEDFGAEFFATQDAGTGPYKYGEFAVGTSYELVAFDEYWGGAPAYESIVFDVISNMSTIQLQLESGALDGLVGFADKTTFEAFAANESLVTYTFDSMQTPTMFLNPDGVFGDDEVRKSFVSGIDYETLAINSLGETGEPTTEVFPVNMIPAEGNQSVVTFNPEALAELAQGGLAGQTIEIGYPGVTPAAQALSDNLAAQLNAAGISATTVGYPAGTFYSTVFDPELAPDITFFTGFPDTGTPDAWARVFYTPEGGLDFFSAEVPGVIELLDEALVTGDTSLYAEVAQLVSESGYWYSVVSAKGTAVFQQGITGVEGSNNPIITGVLDFTKIAPAS